MKKTAKLLTLALAVCMPLAMAGCGGGGTENAQLKIGIVQYQNHVALDSAREGFIKALADNGYEDGKNITITYQNAQGDQSNLGTICHQLISDQSDLILGIATPAVQTLAQKTTEIPVLGTAVTDYVEAKVVNSDQAPGGNVTGTSDMNPIEEQIDLLKKLVPDAKTVGVLYASSEDNSVLQAKLAKEAIESKGLKYVEATVTNVNDIQQVTQSIVDKCDAIYIPTDNMFASAMPIVHGVTKTSKTPTICGESGMVQTGGFATLGINYYDLGYQTGLMAVKILKGEAKPESMPVEKPSQYDYAINGEVAAELGIEIPADLQDSVIQPEASPAQ